MWIKFFVVVLVIMLVIVVVLVVNHHLKPCVLFSWIQSFVLLQTNKRTWRHLQEGTEDDDENYYYSKVKLLENPKLLVITIHHLGSSILRLLPLFLQELYNLSIPNQQHILFVPSCTNTNRVALISNDSGKQKTFCAGKYWLNIYFDSSVIFDR